MYKFHVYASYMYMYVHLLHTNFIPSVYIMYLNMCCIFTDSPPYFGQSNITFYVSEGANISKCISVLNYV